MGLIEAESIDPSIKLFIDAIIKAIYEAALQPIENMTDVPLTSIEVEFNSVDQKTRFESFKAALKAY